MRDLVARHQQTGSGPHRAVAICAQFRAGAAQAAAIVVGRVDQVPQVQFAGRAAALELDAALVVGVVEQQLVIAGAAEFLAARAPLRGAVAVPGRIGGGAVPQRAVAAGDVALSRGAMVMRRLEHGRVEVSLALAARRG